MPRRKLPDKAKIQIANIYDELSQNKASGDTPQHVSAKWIHNVFVERHGAGHVSLRKVSDWLREFRDRAIVQEAVWEPWSEEAETSEESAFLTWLNFVYRIVFNRPMSKTESVWGKRIRFSIADLQPVPQAFISALYAMRERVSLLLGDELYTADLDAWLTIRTKIGNKAYQRLIKTGFLPLLPEWRSIKESIVEPLNQMELGEYENTMLKEFAFIGHQVLPFAELGREVSGPGELFMEPWDSYEWFIMLMSPRAKAEGEDLVDVVHALEDSKEENDERTS